MPSTLDINLSAIVANYQLLKAHHSKNNSAAVVKADAYGLGMNAVSMALWNAGCRDFFVATLEEGIALRAQLPQATIAVFSGLLKGEESEYTHFRLLPVLNDLSQVERAGTIPSILHVDTGMTRLGLNSTDLAKINPANISYVMSHLACASDPHHPKNAEQLMRFREALKLFPGAKASLSNSAGIFLSPDFHFDIARPGCALYGINPTNAKNPMQQVATLSAPILQIRKLHRDETVGYNATYTATSGTRIAVVSLGYADGWMRSMSNKGHAFVAGYQVPIIGIVSMDMIMLDITGVPEALLTDNTRAEFINDKQTVDDIAKQCNTIGYEIFTRIGNRVRRVHQNH